MFVFSWADPPVGIPVGVPVLLKGSEQCHSPRWGVPVGPGGDINEWFVTKRPLVR